jgi:branched-chain amino acid transport system substrate-binding protein
MYYRQRMSMIFVRFLCALGLALGLVPAAAATTDPIRVNVVLPLTGPGSFAGASERSALEALAAQTNKNGGIRGRQLEFEFADDQSNPQVAVQLTNGLIADKVAVILGSGLTATCNAMAALAKNGPLVYCFSGGYQPVAGSFTFGASISSTFLVGSGVRYLHARGLRKIATITTTDSTGQDGDRALSDAVADPENAGTTFVAREHFNPTDVSVAAQIARIKTAAPDAIVAWTTGTPLATVLRGLNDAGLENVPVVVSSGNAVYAQLKQYDDFAPKELLIPSDGVLAPDKVTDHRQRAAIDTVLAAMAPAKADFLSITAWDPGLLVVAALRALGPDASAEQLRSYIANLKGFVGVNGEYDFAEVPNRGTDQRDAYIVRYNAATSSFTGVSKAGGEPSR